MASLALFRWAPGSAFRTALLLSAAFLTYIHVYRSLYDYDSWKIDCSVAVMMLTTKVVYLG
jgi:hypothetical protein